MKLVNVKDETGRMLTVGANELYEGWKLYFEDSVNVRGKEGWK